MASGVTLAQLKYTCRLYGQLTSYDESLLRFRARVAPAPDPSNAAHRAALFAWLNSWGCRQFAREHHATSASSSLIRWAREWVPQLPAASEDLTDLSWAQLATCAAAYDALRESLASTRILSAGRTASVTYGPTGAAKTLFALRPNAVPPWDDPIRKRLGYDGGSSSFRRYLESVADDLRDLSAEAGVPVSQLPGLIGRPQSSPPKLIDEYNWVVITKGLTPP